MDVDITEWKEMIMLTEELDMATRHLLFEYSNLLDSQGRSTTQTKILSRNTGLAEKDVRKRLIRAKDLGWLTTVKIDGRKGYEVKMPEELC